MLKNTERLIGAISKTLWGTPMLVLLFGCGVYLSIRLHFFQITKLGLWMRETFGTLFKKQEKALGKITPYQAVASALASSVGTGNIVGVATAIAAGGPGAVFWMWVSAFFGMATKYAEIVLAVKFRVEKDGETYGGPMYYIEKGLGKGYRPLAVIFSVSGIFACLGMGAMSQSNSIASVMSGCFGLSDKLCGIALCVLTALVISGGVLRISSAAGKLVPIMAGLYLLGGVAVFLLHPQKAFAAIGEIFRHAITPSAVYGGAAGEMTRQAMRFGIARGVFSNEAGLGSAPMIHASANTKAPVKQGLWGVFEVFVDTMLICSVTAVAVIAANTYGNAESGAAIVSLAFGKLLGNVGGMLVNVATVLFALSTILGWSCYGERCVIYLSRQNKTARHLFRLSFIMAVMLGACLNAYLVWELGDMFNGMMMVPNLIALILLSGHIISETRRDLK